jgi:hypothetical protein
MAAAVPQSRYRAVAWGRDMNPEISWVFEVTVNPESLDEFKALVARVSVEDEAAEPDSLNLECFADGYDVHFYERFRDSPSAVFHLQRLMEHYAGPLLSLCALTQMTVYGEPSDELRAALAGFSPRYLSVVAGYTRR